MSIKTKTAKSDIRSGSRSPHRNEYSSREGSRSRSRSRSKSKERIGDNHNSRTRNNTDLVRSWRYEMDEKRNATHSTHNKSPINTCSAVFKTTYRWYYSASKVCFGSAGYYEELPPLYFDGIGISIRAFPLYNNGHSAIGLVLVNKEEIMDRVAGKYDQPISIEVSLGGNKKSIGFTLHEFAQKRVVFKEVPYGLALWNSKNYVSFEFIFKKKAYRQDYHKVFGRKIRLFELSLKYGELKVYSINGKDFDALNDVSVGRCDDKENNNNNSNTKMDKDNVIDLENDGYVRCNTSIFASLGTVFENMVYGSFKTSKVICLNITLEQIQCMIWYACTEQLHLQADPALHYALGSYLHNDDLKNKALRACIADFKVENIMTYVRLYDKYKISKKNGLELLGVWINKMKKMGKISDTLYARISEYKYVENCV